MTFTDAITAAYFEEIRRMRGETPSRLPYERLTSMIANIPAGEPSPKQEPAPAPSTTATSNPPYLLSYTAFFEHPMPQGVIDLLRAGVKLVVVAPIPGRYREEVVENLQRIRRTLALPDTTPPFEVYLLPAGFTGTVANFRQAIQDFYLPKQHASYIYDPYVGLLGYDPVTGFRLDPAPHNGGQIR